MVEVVLVLVQHKHKEVVVIIQYFQQLHPLVVVEEEVDLKLVQV